MTPLLRAAQVLDQAIAGRVFPGAVVEVGTAAGLLTTLARGTLDYGPDSPAVHPGTIYDLASLTKVLATAMLAAGLLEARRLQLDDPVSTWCPYWTGWDRQPVTVRHLLEHASGLPAHRPYFETCAGRDAIERAIAVEPLEYAPGSRSIYSDAGFILLGLLLERAGGAPLDIQFDAWRRAALGAHATIGFCPPAAWRNHIAPTEVDDRRGGMLIGSVHDENAAALGGVAGHAGLFGTAAAAGACARWWMAEAARSVVVTEFLRRGHVPGSSRALGWDTALPTSSCGTRMPPTAVGHTGFTGTSLWIDREQGRYIVFLSNRVHPSANREGIQLVRRALHDAVADDLSLGG